MMMQRNDNQSQLSIISIITSKDFYHQKHSLNHRISLDSNYYMVIRGIN